MAGVVLKHLNIFDVAILVQLVATKYSCPGCKLILLFALTCFSLLYLVLECQVPPLAVDIWRNDLRLIFHLLILKLFLLLTLLFV